MNNNICVGIDAGSNTSKIAADGKIIAECPKLDLIELREEAEIYFDEPVFSCVAAVPDNFSNTEREKFIYNAKKSGFKNIELISPDDAIFDKEKNQKILIFDFGASKSKIIFFNNKIIDKEIISGICGNEFDKIFASWLRERFNLSLINEKDLLITAEKFKKEFSLQNKIIWRNVEILREDFERLIYFSIKRASHTAKRFLNCYNPDKFIMIGGCCEINLVKKIFSDLFPKIEFNRNLIALKAAQKANSLSLTQKHAKKLDSAAKLKEIKGSLISIEDLLNRKQKDRLYALFRQIEAPSANNPALIKLLENLVDELKKESAKIKK